VISEDDVTLIIQALFDIRTELRLLRSLLTEDENGEQGHEEEDS
jgi:hypothetical protein